MKWRSKKIVLKSAEIEKICWELFSVELKLKNILLNNAFTGNKSYTSVFQNDRNEIFALLTCEDVLSLADVKNIIKQMGMRPQFFLPPDGNENYFNIYAKKSFDMVFPGRKAATNQDLEFYQSFAPYSPALVRISKIDGGIKNFDASWNKWISAIDFSYYRVKVG